MKVLEYKGSAGRSRNEETVETRKWGIALIMYVGNDGNWARERKERYSRASYKIGA